MWPFVHCATTARQCSQGMLVADFAPMCLGPKMQQRQDIEGQRDSLHFFLRRQVRVNPLIHAVSG